MNIKREARTKADIAQIIGQIKKALSIKHEICIRYSSCYDCPLSKLELFDLRTCEEMTKLVDRLDLAYKVVEEL